MTPESFISLYKAALASQSWQAVEPLIHENACVTFSDGSVHIGKRAVEVAFTKNFSLIQNESFEIGDIHWLIQEATVAVYLFSYTWTGIYDGKTIGGSGRGTSVLKKGGDRWYLLSEHLTKR